MELKIPVPKFNVGDQVVPKGRTTNLKYTPKPPEPGIIEARSFDNLLHASQWRYQIRWGWGNEHVTNWHYCYDLELYER